MHTVLWVAIVIVLARYDGIDDNNPGLFSIYDWVRFYLIREDGTFVMPYLIGWDSKL